MNGATADPWLKTISIPNKARTIIIGNNQYFFLSFKNSQNSFIKSIIYLIKLFLITKSETSLCPYIDKCTGSYDKNKSSLFS